MVEETNAVVAVFVANMTSMCDLGSDLSDIFQVYVNPEDIKFASRSGKLKPNLNDADVERVKR